MIHVYVDRLYSCHHCKSQSITRRRIGIFPENYRHLYYKIQVLSHCWCICVGFLPVFFSINDNNFLVKSLFSVLLSILLATHQQKTGIYIYSDILVQGGIIIRLINMQVELL